MVSYGVVALNHDAALAVLIDGELAFFKKSSEYSKIPNDFFLNYELVSDAFKVAAPDRVGFFENPYLKKYRQFISGQFNLAFDFDLFPKTYLKRIGFENIPIECHSHHKSHVAYAKYSLGLEEAVYLVADAIGEMDTVSIWHVKGSSFKKSYSIKYPASLGLFYSAFTKLAGMIPVQDEGKFMALSKLGDPKPYVALVKPYLYKNVHLGIKDFDISKIRTPDLAAAVQEVFQEEILRLAQKCVQNYPGLPIVFTGGCAYNKLAVEYVADKVPKFFVAPNPGDASSSIGAAYLTYLKMSVHE
jgi:carbamoyltransferase